MNDYEAAFREAFVHNSRHGFGEWDVPEVLKLRDGKYHGPEWDAYMEASVGRFAVRDEWVQKWSWAVPTDKALDAIAELSPIVEVGCGNGYWAMLLRERGVDIQCFDIGTVYRIGTHGKLQPYTAIARGDQFRAMRMYPERTLMLCWAPYASPMAYDCLTLTRAEHVVWIGEFYGCNGDERASKLLGNESAFELVKNIDIPQYYGVRDAVWIFKRRQPTLTIHLSRDGWLWSATIPGVLCHSCPERYATPREAHAAGVASYPGAMVDV